MQFNPLTKHVRQSLFSQGLYSVVEKPKITHFKNRTLQGMDSI